MDTKERSKLNRTSRVKTGCLTCRNKRRKCDEIKAIDKESAKMKCQYCMLKNFECTWPATVFGPVFVNTSIEDGESIKRKKLSQPKPTHISGGLQEFMSSNTTDQLSNRKGVKNGVHNLSVPPGYSPVHQTPRSPKNKMDIMSPLPTVHPSMKTSNNLTPAPITTSNLQANNDLQSVKLTPQMSTQMSTPVMGNGNDNDHNNATSQIKKTTSVLSLKNYNFDLIQSSIIPPPSLPHLSNLHSFQGQQQQATSYSGIQNYAKNGSDQSPIISTASLQNGRTAPLSMQPPTQAHHNPHPVIHPFETPKFPGFGFDDIESPRFDSMKRDAIDYNQFVDLMEDTEPIYYEIPDTLRDFMYLNAAAATNQSGNGNSNIQGNNNNNNNNNRLSQQQHLGSPLPFISTMTPSDVPSPEIRKQTQYINIKNESPISVPSDVPPPDLFKQYFQSETFQNIEPPLIPEWERVALMKNYVTEISDWLDMFDQDRHYGTIIPQMALDCPPLMNSLLALSAKQFEATHDNYPRNRAMLLYQYALQQLVNSGSGSPDKNAFDVELPASGGSFSAGSNSGKTMEQKMSDCKNGVLPACVNLCVFAMMSSSPKTWRRHLEGCFMLFKSFGIHGFTNPLEKSIFWSFIRMDVCSAVIGEQGTLIDSKYWLPPDRSIYEAGKLFREQCTSTNWDMYANYMVFLVGRVLNLVSSADPTMNFEMEWKLLWEEIKSWEIYKPIGMRPIYENDDPTTFPFPKILYSNAPATSGNQMYHMATILMLQNKPRLLKLNTLPNDSVDYRRMTISMMTSPSVSSSPVSEPKHQQQSQHPNSSGYQIHSKSLTWHARRIVGIGFTNSDHGAYTNSLQPLWVAGKLTSSITEHNLILKHLNSMEKDCGWPTKSRCKDLIEYWNGIT
ncbi:hypothetical protein CANARDRAFT_5168 [[Candida] arabinofermentans NRRL YB-2248]|uniref:Zn(2)-C6 fungal-type domain-containing protein n=1 Tax=[Candida] arabinofermentans NRRL YB-2248 TaxID=983967 RepID=A0A1E4T7X1_9ASCO|nr:hypothetical protein CANARDRAFT_5168 [[Candida] arabinofermentans NRRL YB-2248]